MTRVCHLSSAHRGLDVRIFHKECRSLAAAGYETHLVITATEQEVAQARSQGVTVHSLTPAAGRFARMFQQAWRCYRKGRKIDADIYHFHDAELIPYGIALALMGKRVIYDVHEDLPQDILTKEWISPWIRRVIAMLVSGAEYFSARYFLSVAAATPFIAKRFKAANFKAVDINNYPLPGELTGEPIDWAKKNNQVCYVGGISRIRGILEVVQAIAQVRTDVRLQLAGSFSEADVEASARADMGWQRVDALGWQDRAGVRAVLQRSMAGLVTLHPVINYLDALPVKMFEYMAAGVPVIASNFPLWREIVEGNACGICVDPLDPTAIAKAIDYLVQHPQEAERMGRNGQRAVHEKYNWTNEESKLLQLYDSLV